MKMLEEAGLPAGVINFIPGSGGKVGNPVLSNSNLAGVHFTGSTATFHHIWKTIGNNIDKYKTYPRIVGETGGKDFCLAHESVGLDELSTAVVPENLQLNSKLNLPPKLSEVETIKRLEEIAEKNSVFRSFNKFKALCIFFCCFCPLT